MGPYQLKCTLDPLVLSRIIPQGHLCLWPHEAPGYRIGYDKYYPGLPSSLRLQALWHFHAQMKKEIPSLCFAETVSHMCWEKRRGGGALDDSMQSFNKRARRML